MQIINLSLGHPIYAPAKYDPLVQAVETRVAAGIVVVVAAGNNGWIRTLTANPATPASTRRATRLGITVGAVDTKNTITRDDDRSPRYSSRGPTWFDAFAKPDVVAPGVHLVSDTDTLVVSRHERCRTTRSGRERPPDAATERHEHGRRRRRAASSRWCSTPTTTAAALTPNARQSDCCEYTRHQAAPAPTT